MKPLPSVKTSLRIALSLFAVLSGLAALGQGTHAKVAGVPAGTPPGNELVAGKEGTAKTTAPPKASDTTSSTNTSQPGAVVDSSYRIGVADELMISVWHEPELSTPVVVRPDGVITLPLLNDVHVVGLSTGDLRALLTERLKPFLTEPQVTVIVRSIHSRKVYLIGEVVRPGAYPLNSKTTVLQLLAEAGGIGPYGKEKSIYVLRELGGKHIRIGFNYKKAITAGSDKYDPLLLPGDMVVVP